MNSFSSRIFDRRAGYIAAAVAMLFATIVPALVSAAQVTERSIALSSSSADANGVTYQANFTAVQDAAAFVIDFCSNSPVIGEACTPPAGFDASGATTATAGFTIEKTTSKVVLTGNIDVSTEDQVSVELEDINNPTNAGPLYARIVTYDTDANADLYESTDLGDGVRDQGSVAMSITPTVGVQGAVLETLTFCIAKNAITENCNLSGNTAPTLELGESTAAGLALQPGTVSTGNIYTQLTTNAVGGAIVSLKSGVSCGGLKRLNVSTCDIAPALALGVDGNTARFGVKTATAVDALGASGSEVSGTLSPIGNYNNTTYALNYAANNLTGVTSTYGDPFIDTDDAPVNNKNMQLTFGASITNQTPAGLYSADLSMIATGKF